MLKWSNKPWARSLLDPVAGKWVDCEYKISSSSGRACHCPRLLKFGDIIEMSAGVAIEEMVELVDVVTTSTHVVVGVAYLLVRLQYK